MEQIHTHLRAIAAAVAANPSLARQATVPDYPFFGPALSKAPIRVSIVGKANLRWPPPRHTSFLGRSTGESKAPLAEYLGRHSLDEILEASRRAGEEFRLDRVGGYYDGTTKRDSGTTGDSAGYSAAWWRFILEYAYGLLTEAPARPRARMLRGAARKTLEQVHTTNLFKIARVEGNPSGDLARVQLQAGLSMLLQTEFRIAKPDVILLPIGREYDNLLEEVLPGWNVVAPSAAGDLAEAVSWTHCPCPAFRLRHPQGASSHFLDHMYDRVRRTVARR